MGPGAQTMKLNPADLVAVLTVAVVGLLQFVRCRRDFSQVLYETIFFVPALVGAVRIAGPLHQSTGVPMLFSFVAPLVVFGMAAVILATLLNRVFEFELGRAGWVLGIGLALTCAGLAGHAVLRAVLEAYGPQRPEFGEAMMRSELARQLYYFTALKGLLAKMGPARPG